MLGDSGFLGYPSFFGGPSFPDYPSFPGHPGFLACIWRLPAGSRWYSEGSPEVLASDRAFSPTACYSRGVFT